MSLFRVVAALSLCAILLYLGAPRLSAAIALSSGNAALALIETNTPPTRAGSLRVISAQEAALDILPSSVPHLNVALIALSMFETGSGSADDDAMLLQVAQYHLERSLALAPGQARAWMMLATVRLRQGNLEEAASALALSFQADPHAPFLATARWPLTFLVQDRLDRETRQWAALEYLAYFRSQPEPAARLALRQGRIDELRALVLDSEMDTARLAGILRQMQPGGA